MEYRIVSLLTSVFIIFLIPTIYACSTPVVYNEYGVPIPIFGRGTLPINASEYPSSISILQYNLTVENTNDQGFTLTFTPSKNIEEYVDGVDEVFEPNETKTITLPIRIDGPDVSGDIYLMGRCADGLPTVDTVIRLRVEGRGDQNKNLISRLPWVYIGGIIMVGILLFIFFRRIRHREGK